MSSAYPTWLPAVNWLYRRYKDAYSSQVTIGAVPSNCSGNDGLTFGEVVANLDSRLVFDNTPDWHCEVYDDTRGIVRIYGSSPATLTAPDRFLANLGFDMDPGEVLPSASQFLSRRPSPLAIPLQSCEMVKVDRTKERQFVLDRFQRGHGDPYGAAEIWRLTIWVDAPALHSLRTGWCLSGRILVSPFSPMQHQSGVDPWTSEYNGYLDVQVLGLEAGDWINPTVRNLYRCSLLVALAVA